MLFTLLCTIALVDAVPIWERTDTGKTVLIYSNKSKCNLLLTPLLVGVARQTSPSSTGGEIAVAHSGAVVVCSPTMRAALILPRLLLLLHLP